MGKGSGRRPSQVSNERFQAAWDSVFGKKEQGEDHYPDALDGELAKWLREEREESKSVQRRKAVQKAGEEIKKSYRPDEAALNRRTTT